MVFLYFEIWSDNGLKRRPKLVTTVNYLWCCMTVYLIYTVFTQMKDKVCSQIWHLNM